MPWTMFPQRAQLGAAKEAEDAHDQYAIENQRLIRSPCCEPSVPHVYWRQVGNTLVSCPCREGA